MNGCIRSQSCPILLSISLEGRSLAHIIESLPRKHLEADTDYAESLEYLFQVNSYDISILVGPLREYRA